MARFSIVVLLAVASLTVAPAAWAGGHGGGGGGNNNNPPTACFTQAPAAPRTGDTVTFSSSCSSDSDGSITGQAWDLDNDGSFDDGTGVTATRSWTAPGNYTVRLGVIDDDGDVDVQSQTVTVANRGPVAGFSFSPAQPVVGQTVRLTSTSTDPDGSLASQSWDLDNDGRFNDARGPSASFTPSAARSYPVSIRVVDNTGAAATASKTFAVGPPQPTAPAEQFDNSASPQPPVAATPQLRWLDPFPVVRIRGRTTRYGAFLSLFTVRAPSGARIELRCAGRGCPVRRVRKLVKTKSGRPRTVRFKTLEGRLRAGIHINVLVTQDGMVGKHTRFTIRRIKLPVRTDRCLVPGSGRPVDCPAAPPG